MKNRILAATVAVLGVFAAGSAVAADRCNVPAAEWQPTAALKKKLEAEGWKVRRIKSEDGCYEAYAIDAKGRRVEAYFNPKTLEAVKVKDED